MQAEQVPDSRLAMAARGWTASTGQVTCSKLLDGGRFPRGGVEHNTTGNIEGGGGGQWPAGEEPDHITRAEEKPSGMEWQCRDGVCVVVSVDGCACAVSVAARRAINQP